MPQSCVTVKATELPASFTAHSSYFWSTRNLPWNYDNETWKIINELNAIF